MNPDAMNRFLPTLAVRDGSVPVVQAAGPALLQAPVAAPAALAR